MPGQHELEPEISLRVAGEKDAVRRRSLQISARVGRAIRAFRRSQRAQLLRPLPAPIEQALEGRDLFADRRLVRKNLRNGLDGVRLVVSGIEDVEHAARLDVGHEIQAVPLSRVRRAVVQRAAVEHAFLPGDARGAREACDARGRRHQQIAGTAEREA